MIRRRAPRRDQSGFTVLEVVIAISLLAAVMVSLAPAFYGSLKLASTANHRTTATGLAVAATEAVRAIPYADVGFYGDQTTPTQCSAQTNPVTLGSTSPSSPGPLITPTTTSTVNSVTYTVNRCIDWVDAGKPVGASTYSLAYKATTVYVSWTDQSGTHTVTQTSAVYPGGEGAYTGPENNYNATTTTSTTTLGPPSAPTNPGAVTEAAPTNVDAIDVGWQAPTSSPTPITGYIVEYNTTGNFAGSGTYASSPTVTGGSCSTLPGDLCWTAGSLTAGTTYYFQIISVGSNGSDSSPSSPVVQATTGTPTTSTTAGCTVSALSVSPTSGVVDGTGKLVNASGFSLAVNGTSSCSSVSVSYTTSGGSQSALLTANGGQFNGTAGTSGTVWNVGNDQFTVVVNGAQYSPLVQVQVNICKEKGNSGHC
ncbi:MAG TPA: prepilin-type N-terminal cleavage/methylation domain-containing protein [Acidimicrobiales bacterium]|nr:prepilin-type N-terminal cleavage/methylation domain-containing protein [Acidimicrobiales bacterium]